MHRQAPEAKALSIYPFHQILDASVDLMCIVHAICVEHGSGKWYLRLASGRGLPAQPRGELQPSQLRDRGIEVEGNQGTWESRLDTTQKAF